MVRRSNIREGSTHYEGSTKRGDYGAVKTRVRLVLIVVFRGSLATIARDGPGSAMYFVVYEYVKRRLTPEGHTFSPFAVVMAGGLAGILLG